MRTCFHTLSLLAAILIAIPLLAADGDVKADVKKKDDANPAAKADKADKKDAADPAAKDEKKDADKKDGDKKGKEKEPEKKDEKKKIATGAEFDGKLKSLEANSQKDMTIELSWQYKEPNLQAQRDIYNTQNGWAKRQYDIVNNRGLNPIQKGQQLQQLQNDINNYRPPATFTVKTQTKDVPIRAVEEVVVRALWPMVDYDDKGNVKKYTAKELKELRKDGLPGYPCDFDQLRAGQTVHVFLKKVEKAKANKDNKDNKDNKAGGLGGIALPGAGGKAPAIRLDDDANLGAVQRPEAVMIVILRDVPLPK